MADKDFDRVWAVYLAGNQSDFIQFDPPLFKHEFLRYLRGERGAVFHGSNNPDIIIFEPRTATFVSYANYAGISLEICS